MNPEEEAPAAPPLKIHIEPGSILSNNIDIHLKLQPGRTLSQPTVSIDHRDGYSEIRGCCPVRITDASLQSFAELGAQDESITWPNDATVAISQRFVSDVLRAAVNKMGCVASREDEDVDSADVGRRGDQQARLVEAYQVSGTTSEAPHPLAAAGHPRGPSASSATHGDKVANGAEKRKASKVPSKLLGDMLVARYMLDSTIAEYSAGNEEGVKATAGESRDSPQSSAPLNSLVFARRKVMDCLVDLCEAQRLLSATALSISEQPSSVTTPAPVRQKGSEFVLPIISEQGTQVCRQETEQQDFHHLTQTKSQSSNEDEDAASEAPEAEMQGVTSHSTVEDERQRETVDTSQAEDEETSSTNTTIVSSKRDTEFQGSEVSLPFLTQKATEVYREESELQDYHHSTPVTSVSSSEEEDATSRATEAELRDATSEDENPEGMDEELEDESEEAAQTGPEIVIVESGLYVSADGEVLEKIADADRSSKMLKVGERKTESDTGHEIVVSEFETSDTDAVQTFTGEEEISKSASNVFLSVSGLRKGNVTLSVFLDPWKKKKEARPISPSKMKLITGNKWLGKKETKQINVTEEQSDGAKQLTADEKVGSLEDGAGQRAEDTDRSSSTSSKAQKQETGSKQRSVDSSLDLQFPPKDYSLQVTPVFVEEVSDAVANSEAYTDWELRGAQNVSKVSVSEYDGARRRGVAEKVPEHVPHERESQTLSTIRESSDSTGVYLQTEGVIRHPAFLKKGSHGQSDTVPDECQLTDPRGLVCRPREEKPVSAPEERELEGRDTTTRPSRERKRSREPSEEISDVDGRRSSVNVPVFRHRQRSGSSVTGSFRRRNGEDGTVPPDPVPDTVRVSGVSTRSGTPTRKTRRDTLSPEANKLYKTRGVLSLGIHEERDVGRSTEPDGAFESVEKADPLAAGTGRYAADTMFGRISLDPPANVITALPVCVPSNQIGVDTTAQPSDTDVMSIVISENKSGSVEVDLEKNTVACGTNSPLSVCSRCVLCGARVAASSWDDSRRSQLCLSCSSASGVKRKLPLSTSSNGSRPTYSEPRPKTSSLSSSQQYPTQNGRHSTYSVLATSPPTQTSDQLPSGLLPGSGGAGFQLFPAVASHDSGYFMVPSASATSAQRSFYQEARPEQSDVNCQFGNLRDFCPVLSGKPKVSKTSAPTKQHGPPGKNKTPTEYGTKSEESGTTVADFLHVPSPKGDKSSWHAYPYSPSLRSLPLDDTDVQEILKKVEFIKTLIPNAGPVQLPPSLQGSRGADFSAKLLAPEKSKKDKRKKAPPPVHTQETAATDLRPKAATAEAVSHVPLTRSFGSDTQSPLLAEKKWEEQERRPSKSLPSRGSNLSFHVSGIEPADLKRRKKLQDNPVDNKAFVTPSGKKESSKHDPVLPGSDDKEKKQKKLPSKLSSERGSSLSPGGSSLSFLVSGIDPADLKRRKARGDDVEAGEGSVSAPGNERSSTHSSLLSASDDEEEEREKRPLKSLKESGKPAASTGPKQSSLDATDSKRRKKQEDYLTGKKGTPSGKKESSRRDSRLSASDGEGKEKILEEFSSSESLFQPEVKLTMLKTMEKTSSQSSSDV